MICSHISNATMAYCRAAEYEQRIAALEAENAALRDERQRAIQAMQNWTTLNGNLVEHVVAMRIAAESVRDERDDARLLSEKHWIERDDARQSRARLVKLVRALRNDVRNRTLENELCENDLADVQDQRDAAIAAAAAWKRAARKWYAWHQSCLPPCGEAMYLRAITGTAQERRAQRRNANGNT